MGDIFIEFLRTTLPEELAAVLSDSLQKLENGDFLALFQHQQIQALLGHTESQILRDEKPLEEIGSWRDFISRRLDVVLSAKNDVPGAPVEESAAYREQLFLIVATASLYAFLQSNATGPPLPFSSAKIFFPQSVSENAGVLTAKRRDLITSLSVDGVPAYKLTPNIELFCFAQTILEAPALQKHVAASWIKFRTTFLHHRLLSEVVEGYDQIVKDLQIVGNYLLDPESKVVTEDMKVNFYSERASVQTYFGFDKQARKDLDLATKARKFDFAITGLMGKRTKFQQKDTSQLVVLARSAESETNGTSGDGKTSAPGASNPKNLDLNDDTLLESISFTQTHKADEIKEESSLPESLKSLDPGNQPMLNPLDSIILLSHASSITNTNPADGITREETIPYAIRVLEGGSSNWQVYTQALLVRSRIEGYKSRTMERGLLQLQALVDQVIAETSGDNNGDSAAPDSTGTTFLPKAKEGESAPVSERLAYIFALCSPLRWELEAELAARWVSVGGLRSALEIYERLEMWAEAALCWAATEREDKAKKIVRRQLFHATSGSDETANLEEDSWEGVARDPPPLDAPRLYCILGDIDKDTAMYEKAWEVSNHRYARAQRSLGQYYISQRSYAQAAEAYSLSLKVNALNTQARFALGCAYLELHQFKNAVDAFKFCVQLDNEDAESWSNLAAALLHLRPKPKEGAAEGDAESEDSITKHPRQDALRAFKRAANLKHDNARIWSNVLTVAASTNPPSYSDIITAQRRIIELRGPTEGEKCVDEDILDLLIHHVIQQEDGEFDLSKPGPGKFVHELVEKHIKPLITASPRLWTTLAKFYMHTKRPSSALDAHEKAWRAVTSQPKWESGTEAQWDRVVQQTIDLVDAYESLGSRERTEGLAAGSGELVAKDWKFKARSAVRSVLGKGKDAWEDSKGWDRLKERLEELRG